MDVVPATDYIKKSTILRYALCNTMHLTRYYNFHTLPDVKKEEKKLITELKENNENGLHNCEQMFSKYLDKIIDMMDNDQVEDDNLEADPTVNVNLDAGSTTVKVKVKIKL